MLTKLPLVLALAFGLLAGTASATTYVVTNNGLIDPNQNYGCPAGSANCLTSKDLSLSGTGAAGGDIVVTASPRSRSRSRPACCSRRRAPSRTRCRSQRALQRLGERVLGPGIVSEAGSATGSVSGLLDGNRSRPRALVTNLTCATDAARRLLQRMSGHPAPAAGLAAHVDGRGDSGAGAVTGAARPARRSCGGTAHPALRLARQA